NFLLHCGAGAGSDGHWLAHEPGTSLVQCNASALVHAVTQFSTAVAPPTPLPPVPVLPVPPVPEPLVLPVAVLLLLAPPAPVAPLPVVPPRQAPYAETCDAQAFASEMPSASQVNVALAQQAVTAS